MGSKQAPLTLALLCTVVTAFYIVRLRTTSIPVQVFALTSRITVVPDLSVLLPIFNKAHYLDQSLQSIFQLPIAMKRITVVCVDDASTDATPSKIREYQRNHSNIVYVRNERNLGTHMTRIRCVTSTTTQFMVFLDPDDCFVGNGVVVALRMIKEKKGDIVEFGCRMTMRMNRRKFYGCWRNPWFNTTSLKTYRNLIFGGRVNCHLHRKIYRTEVYQRAIMAMPEYVRNARILRCEDNLQLSFFVMNMTTPYYGTPVVGEERHYGLRDNSMGSHYQNTSLNVAQCDYQRQILKDIFGRSAS